MNIDRINEVVELEKLANWEMDTYGNVLFATKVKLMNTISQLTKEDIQYIKEMNTKQ